jgi:integrase
MNKTPAGQPKIKVSNGRLQIVFTYHGDRKYLSLGVPDSKANRYYAETIRQWVEKDIRASTFDPTAFDPTLAKYKNSKSNESVEQPIEQLAIDELWGRFTEYKRPQLSQTTIAKDFERVRLNMGLFA